MRSFGLALAVVLASPARASEHTTEQARAAVEEHVRRTLEEGQGVYPLADVDGRTLVLEFVQVSLVAAGALWKVHDPDRRVGADAFVACLRFHVPEEPAEKEYDVDMLVEPRDGKLAVTEVRVHKEKRLVRGKWVWEPRTPAAGVAPGR